ncbi:unnamed protein product, partial [Heterotrigona itama]
YLGDVSTFTMELNGFPVITKINLAIFWAITTSMATFSSSSHIIFWNDFLSAGIFTIRNGLPAFPKTFSFVARESITVSSSVNLTSTQFIVFSLARLSFRSSEDLPNHSSKY